MKYITVHVTDNNRASYITDVFHFSFEGWSGAGSL